MGREISAVEINIPEEGLKILAEIKEFSKSLNERASDLVANPDIEIGEKIERYLNCLELLKEKYPGNKNVEGQYRKLDFLYKSVCPYDRIKEQVEDYNHCVPQCLRHQDKILTEIDKDTELKKLNEIEKLVLTAWIQEFVWFKNHKFISKKLAFRMMPRNGSAGKLSSDLKINLKNFVEKSICRGLCKDLSACAVKSGFEEYMIRFMDELCEKVFNIVSLTRAKNICLAEELSTDKRSVSKKIKDFLKSNPIKKSKNDEYYNKKTKALKNGFADMGKIFVNVNDNLGLIKQIFTGGAKENFINTFGVQCFEYL